MLADLAAQPSAFAALRANLFALIESGLPDAPLGSVVAALWALVVASAGAASSHMLAPLLVQVSPFADIWNHIIADFSNITSPSALAAFGQVLMIDIMLAGDNAIVVGALAAGLPPQQRKQVILIGIIAALVLRIAFALVVTQLMQIVGLIFAGGLLLLWVSWKMWRELRHDGTSPGSPEIVGDEHAGLRPAKSFAGAAWAVAVADVSMSLDNVLAVAGAARDHPGILVIGLLLSVALMGVAANFIARYIERYRWIAYLGLVVILYVAFKMIYDGIVDPTVGVMQIFG